MPAIVGGTGSEADNASKAVIKDRNRDNKSAATDTGADPGTDAGTGAGTGKSKIKNVFCIAAVSERLVQKRRREMYGRTLSTIPSDVYLQVLQHLSVRDVCRLSITCRAQNLFAIDDCVWKKRYLDRCRRLEFLFCITSSQHLRASILFLSRLQ